MQKLFIGTVVLLAMAFGASTAKASSTEITLSSGSGPTTYTATGSGTLSYINLNFNNWIVVLEQGLTSSPSSIPQGIELISQIACQLVGGCDPLTVDFSGTGFTTAAPSFFTTYNMTAESGSTSSTTQTAWYGTSLLDHSGGLIGSVGFSGGVGSGSKTAVGGGPASSYSLTVQDLFNSPSGGATFSANGEVGVTPEPSTMLLFGSGLLLLGGFLRRQPHHA